MAAARNVREIAQFYVNEVIEPSHRLLSGALRRGSARGEFRNIAVDSAVPALIAPSLLQAMHRHSVGACAICAELTPNEDEAIRPQIDLLLHGLLLQPPQAPAAADDGPATVLNPPSPS